MKFTREFAVVSAQVLAESSDVSSEPRVRRLARIVQKQFGNLDILVPNAGVLGPKGATEEVDWDALSQTISINVLGRILCCRAFIPLLRQAPRGKILLLSRGGATKPMPFMTVYAASKAAVVRFGKTLAEELRGAGIDFNCIATGALNTRMLEEVLAAGPEKVGQSYYEASISKKQSGEAWEERAAELRANLASSDQWNRRQADQRCLGSVN